MKTIVTFLSLTFATVSFAQTPCEDYCLNFDDTMCFINLEIDTNNYSDNIWQIGQPNKTPFDTVLNQFLPKVIVTDTSLFYPPNNQSVFYIRNVVTWGDYYGLKMFSGNYYVQSDSLNDFGTIEMSPDNGSTWIDLFSDTSLSANIIWFNKPVLTGNSKGWKYFEILFSDMSSLFGLNIGDTITYRFSFESDSIPDTLCGLMYDDICFLNFVEGISEIRYNNIKSTIFPNPSSDFFTISFDNPENEIFQLSIYTVSSKPVFTDNNVTSDEILIDGRSLAKGVYIYKLTNLNAHERSWGKFVVQ